MLFKFNFKFNKFLELNSNLSVNLMIARIFQSHHKLYVKHKGIGFWRAKHFMKITKINLWIAFILVVYLLLAKMTWFIIYYIRFKVNIYLSCLRYLIWKPLYLCQHLKIMHLIVSSIFEKWFLKILRNENCIYRSLFQTKH
jgi:hypothetical protein